MCLPFFNARTRPDEIEISGQRMELTSIGLARPVNIHSFFYSFFALRRSCFHDSAGPDFGAERAVRRMCSACEFSFRGNHDWLGGDRFHRLGLFGRGGFRFTFAESFRPDVEAAVAVRRDFPRAPNTLALAEAAIKNAVRADVGFRPPALERLGIILATDGEAPDIVVAVAAYLAARERKVQVHAVLVLRAVIVEAR